MIFDPSPHPEVASPEREAEVGIQTRTGSKPRLLVVSYLFPPDIAVGGRRWAGVTKYLARAGWQIDVVSGARAGSSPPVDGVRTHRVRRLGTANDAYLRLKDLRRRSNPSGGGGGPAEAVTGSRAGGGHLWGALGYALQYPDYSRGWVLRASLAIRRIILDRRVDIVVSSGPPHTAHLAARMGRAGSGVPWLMDLRDPWAETVPAEAPSVFRRFTQFLEKSTLTTCDGVVCNTREYADVLLQRGVRSVHWIPNGIDLETLPPPVPPREGPLTVVHVGTLYVNRDLGPIIMAMDRLQASSSSAAARGMKLEIVGHADERHEAVLREQLARSSLSATQVERTGRVSPDAALDIVRNAHLCLVLAQSQPKQVPAKLYETLGCGVQTLVLAERGSASAAEAERLGALWRDPSDVEGIMSVMTELADGSLPMRPPAPRGLDYRSIASDYGRLLEGFVR